MSILVINAGSSTLKFGLFDEAANEEIAHGLVDWSLTAPHAELVVSFPTGAAQHFQLDIPYHGSAVAQAVDALTKSDVVAKQHWPGVTIVGHRVVHGGTKFNKCVRIDDAVIADINELSVLAPLHNPPALAAIAAARKALPDAVHVAAFDTAFYSDFGPEAYIYPVPYEWFTDWGVRRFGFHGISHQYCAGRAAEMLRKDPKDLHLVTCHLGNGASATAMREGKPVATSMGFTPMEGLMMGTRSGSIDPGILIDVQRRHGVSAEQLDDILNHKSGLAGVSGISSDCRQIEAAAAKGNEHDARLSLDIYARIVRATIGSLAVTLGGIDGLIFTAGVGENAASMRQAICMGLECLGANLDAQRNAAAKGDVDISTEASRCRILVMHTREELMIARQAKDI